MPACASAAVAMLILAQFYMCFQYFTTIVKARNAILSDHAADFSFIVPVRQFYTWLYYHCSLSNCTSTICL